MRDRKRVSNSNIASIREIQKRKILNDKQSGGGTSRDSARGIQRQRYQFNKRVKKKE